MAEFDFEEKLPEIIIYTVIFVHAAYILATIARGEPPT